MAHVRVTHSFDMGAVRVMQQNPAGGVARDMYRRGQNVRATAQRLAGKDTGRLRASIHVEQVQRHEGVGARVGSNVEYAAAHHEGTARWSPAARAGSWCSGPGAGRWSSLSACDRSRAPSTSGRRCRRRGTSPAGLARSAQTPGSCHGDAVGTWPRSVLASSTCGRTERPMARKIEWNGEWIATLIEAEDGSYIAAPVVFDEDDRLVMGAEILAAVVEAGTPIEHPVLHGYSPGHLAELDQHLTHVSAQLGVPLRGW